MECVNCGAEGNSRYCQNCGQRAGVKRITFRDSIEDFWVRVVGFDGIFLRTLRDLTLRPGRVAQDYIRGNRVKYFGPIAYFFFMVTLLLVWLSVLNLEFAELIRDSQESMSLVDRNQQGVNVMTQWAADNIRWILFLAVPFQATAARFLFFRKSGFNLVEHTVPVFYITGHLFWLTMMIFLIRKVTGYMPNLEVSMLSFLYFGYAYSNMMTYQSMVKAFFKGIGVYIGGQFIFVVAVVIIVLLVILLLAMVNPEALNSIRPTPR